MGGIAALAGVVLWLPGLLPGCSVEVDDEGREVRIALIDGAVARVSELECFAIEQAPGAQGSDHGTAVASVLLDVLQSGCADADQVRLGSFPVLDADGGGVTANDVASALSRALEWGADVVNVSIDLRDGSRELEAAVVAAERERVPVVAAAGNRMGLPAGFPAAYPSVVAVGAADVAGTPLWSSATEGVDVYVRGSSVLTLNSRGQWVTREGTSFAAALYTRELAASLR